MPDYGYVSSPPEHPRDVGDVLNRVDEILAADMSIGGQAVRHRIRSVMNGGKEAVAALLGDLAPDLAHLPAANFIYSHLTRLAQKLGHLPDVRVPSIKDASDAQRRRADNRQHLIQAWDSYDELESQMPVLARWLPGYGYACVVVSEKLTPWGDTYPRATIRDSYGVIPGDWGLGSTPIDVSVLRRTSAKRLIESFPNSTRSLRMAIDNARRAPGGGILLGRQTSGILQSRYEDPYLQAVDWVEYIDGHGRWLVLPEHKELLEFIPNPCESQPQFAMGRAPSFDRPAGHHEHAYGLQAMVSKQQLLEEIHMVEAVNSTELNIDGEILSNGGVYQRGRGKINVTTPGTNVNRMNWSLPYQIFEHTARLVDQLRTTINYPIGDDGKSQLSYATGAGLEELSTPSGREIEEYHKATARMFRQLDSIRLEIDEKNSTDRKRFYVVVNNAAYDQTYDPKALIGGQYCVTPDTLVLTTRLTWVPAGQLTYEDQLVGFDEELNQGKGKSSAFRPSMIERLGHRSLECVRVLTDKGEITASLDHGFVTKHRSQNHRIWRTAGDVREGDQIVWTVEPWETVNTYEAGYLAGMYDGEGSVDKTRVSVAQRPGPVLDETLRCLKEMGFEVAVYGAGGGTAQAKILGGKYETWRFLGMVRPRRMIANARCMWDGTRMVTKHGRSAHGGYATVLSVEPVGFQEVVTMQTSTRTFIANGFASHNSTERGYGFLAALDEPERISIGNIMLASGIIDEHGARSMIKGIGDPDEIRSRIDQTRLREFFIAALQGQIPMPPPVIVRTMMDVLDKRDWVTKTLAEVTPSEEEEAELAAQQQQQMAAQPPPGLMSGQTPPDIVSLMSSLGAEGADSSVRTSRTVRT